ncbi:hypothetical protein BDA99DRAFT_609406 [Phascolomyces articulosus]|uniref:Uncharacterized protein n=1 Tax=Phascolomyces articulosus TaxID=60185 RepID=A0AAD5P9S8_9FUNG|nr:hypothetical protein BDA99DRAFT_609406 [Phascolomyces articulosus]
MSAAPYDTDNVTVSLSRLALAKAIKTPDDEESNKEPWTKSIIFHQSHVSDSMRQSMLFPNQPRQRQQRMHGQQRPHSQMLQHHPQGQHPQQRPMSQFPQQRRRSRSSSHMLDQHMEHQPHPQQLQQHHHQQYPQQQQQHQQYPQQRQSRATSPSPQHMLNNNRPSSSYEMYRQSSSDRSGSQGSSSHRQTPTSQERATPSQGRRNKAVAISDEDEEEEGITSDDDDESQPTPMPRKSASFQILNSQATSTPALSSNAPLSRPKSTLQLPSDDDDDEESEEDVLSDEEDEDVAAAAKHGKAQQQSVLKEKNNSRRKLHDKLRHSDSEDSQDHDDDEEDDESDHEDRIIEQRQQQNFANMARRPSSTLLDDDALKARRMSTLRQLERGPSMHKRSRSQGDLNLMAEQAQVQAVMMEQQQNPYAEAVGGKSGAIERWRLGVTDGTPNSSRPTSIQDSSSSGASPASNIDGVVDGENDQRDSFMPEGFRRERRSTIGEMDMMYYHMQQQQQQQMQWQMQQAAQMQQMAQIQQYQQAAMMMQQQQQMMAIPTPVPMASSPTPRTAPNQNPNRKSVSAMDLLTQLEKEKDEAKFKPYNPKTRVTAPNGAKIDSGLLGRLPKNKSHNLSFQQLEQQGGVDRNKFLMRASRSDMNLSSMGQNFPASQSDMNLSAMGSNFPASRSDMNLSAMGSNLTASRSDMNLASMGQQQRRSRSPGPEKALRSSSALDISNMGKKGKLSNTDARRRSEMMPPQVTPSISTPNNLRQSYMPSANNNVMYGQYLMPMGGNGGGGAPMGMMTPSMSSGNRSAPMNGSSSRRSIANWSNGGYQ